MDAEKHTLSKICNELDKYPQLKQSLLNTIYNNPKFTELDLRKWVFDNIPINYDSTCTKIYEIILGQSKDATVWDKFYNGDLSKSHRVLEYQNLDLIDFTIWNKKLPNATQQQIVVSDANGIIKRMKPNFALVQLSKGANFKGALIIEGNEIIRSTIACADNWRGFPQKYNTFCINDAKDDAKCKTIGSYSSFIKKK